VRGTAIRLGPVAGFHLQLQRLELLAELIAERESIAVGGSAGKTTVTYMLGHILTEAGFDPTVLVGDGSSSRAASLAVAGG